jgi:hyperosmotically inducible protein
MRTARLLWIGLVGMLAAPILAADVLPQPKALIGSPLLPPDGLVRKVQRELIALPDYTVFDYLSCKQLEDGSIVLTGQVTNAALKRSAEAAASAVAGTVPIVNRIEVLPASARDQRLRAALYRQIYGDDAMTSYAVRKIAPIHIIVRNGQVTLEGVVDNAVDRLHVESAVEFAAGVSPRNRLIAVQGGEQWSWKSGHSTE